MRAVSAVTTSAPGPLPVARAVTDGPAALAARSAGQPMVAFSSVGRYGTTTAELGATA